MTTVFNLRTYNEQVFSLPPREAVIAAYAQSLGDWNTWEYEQKYGAKVRKHKRTWWLGDFSAIERGS
jgi:hypothetical protein